MSKFSTKKETIETGLQLLARKAVYEHIRDLRGEISWTDDDQLPSSIPTTQTSQEDAQATGKYKSVHS